MSEVATARERFLAPHRPDEPLLRGETDGLWELAAGGRDLAIRAFRDARPS